MSEDYMTFEQASEFLNTPRSTLYRWLREGKVPGHKLGRQWRFLRSELEDLRASGPDASPTPLAELERALDARTTRDGALDMPTHHRLLWDAFDHDASAVHIQPNGASFDALYRTPRGLEHVTTLDAGAVTALMRQYLSGGSADEPLMSQALYAMQRGDQELFVRVQHMATVAGPRLALRLIRHAPTRATIERIAPDADDAEILRRFARAPYGIVLVSGRSGSGKTTTAYACLSELVKAGDRIVFSMEPSAEFLIDGVNQVEVDLDDARAYRHAFAGIFDSDPDVLFVATGFAPRHRDLLFSTALNAAESGHLVLVQIEAEDPGDALERFQAHVERPIDDWVVGVTWQELVRAEGAPTRAEYTFLPGPLDVK